MLALCKQLGVDLQQSDGSGRSTCGKTVGRSIDKDSGIAGQQDDAD
jgi:hypothetical protein